MSRPITSQLNRPSKLGLGHQSCAAFCTRSASLVQNPARFAAPY